MERLRQTNVSESRKKLGGLFSALSQVTQTTSNEVGRNSTFPSRKSSPDEKLWKLDQYRENR